MNIPKEALDAASQRLFETAESPTGWLSDLDAEAEPKNGLVRLDEPGSIDVWHAVQDALPHIEAALRTQIANEISDAAITLTSGTIAEVARSVQRQAARIAEEGNTK